MEGSFVKVMELSEINLGECHKRHTRDSGAAGESEPGIWILLAVKMNIKLEEL